MRILFLTNLLPYPLDNGGKIKTYTTLKALFESNHTIDLLCFKETKNEMKKEEDKLLNYCKSVEQVYLPLTTANYKKYMIGIAIKSLLSRLPFSIYKYQSAQMEQCLYERKDFIYDAIYFDHLPMCVYVEVVKKYWPKAKLILDEHNCEAMITSRKVGKTKQYLKRAFLKIEAIKLSRFEVDSINKVNKTIILSENDYQCLKELVGKDFSHSIIPIGVPDRGVKNSFKSDILNILFIGTLTWEPNNAGLIWFLKEIVPILEKAKLNYHLFIVGKNPSDEVKGLCNKYQNTITITGYVKSVDEYYDKCDCTIVPLFIGSGQRVKLIEAFSKGMPAISTTIGAEGLVYQDKASILIANKPDEFAQSIIEMTNSELRNYIQKNCRKVYEMNYSPNIISNCIVKAVLN